MNLDALHIGCGTVYLKGWVNIDIPSDNCFLAPERPDLVAKLETTAGHYYARHQNETFEKFRAGPRNNETVCDRYGSFTNIPARSDSAIKIASVQVFEHLSIEEAQKALKECWRVLKYGGRLLIDIPDTEESIRLYGRTQDEFYIRHISGPKQRGAWGFHVMAYSREELINLAESFGFRFVEEDPNIHSYPAIALVFKKITKV